MSLTSRADRFIESLQSPPPFHDDEVEAMRVEIIRLLSEAGDQALSRDHASAHCTASAMICDADGAVLALFHRKLHRWLQPGGHVEMDDVSPLAAALREAREESGLAELIPLSGVPIDVDIHEIPARGQEAAHLHYDIRYAFLAPHPEQLCCSDEALDIKWLSGDELEQWCASETSIKRLVRAGLTHLKAFRMSSSLETLG